MLSVIGMGSSDTLVQLKLPTEIKAKSAKKVIPQINEDLYLMDGDCIIKYNTFNCRGEAYERKEK